MIVSPLVLAVLLSPLLQEGTRLRRDVFPKGDQKPMGAPIVEGSLAGVPTLILLDTGAGTHTLTSWLVKKARLETREAEVKLRDVAGRSLDTRMVRGAKVALAGLGSFSLEDAVVTDFPPFFEEAGIGAVLSPQLLPAPGRVIVLDMPRARVRLEDAAAGRHAAGLLPQSLATDGIDGCTDLAAPLANLVFRVPTLLEGEDLLLTIDTGAERTKLREGPGARARLKLRGAPRAGAGGIGGAHEAVSVSGVRIRAGAAEATLEVDLAPVASRGTCRADGVLGMDLLRRCVLVVSRMDFAGACEPSAEDKRRAPPDRH